MLYHPPPEKDVWKAEKVRVIGLSKDSVEKQEAFVQKEKLTVSFQLLYPSGANILCFLSTQC